MQKKVKSKLYILYHIQMFWKIYIAGDLLTFIFLETEIFPHSFDVLCHLG